MKKVLSLAGVIISTLLAIGEDQPLSDGYSYTEKVGGYTWTFSVINGEASVGGGDWNSPAVPTTTAGALTIPSTLGGRVVTSISACAFSYCTELTDVTIAEGVLNIGDYAFWWCGGLASAVIPSGVTNIGYGAFCDCSSLTRVTIPSSVMNIGEATFLECDMLGAIDFEGAPPKGLEKASINQNVAIRYNADYQDEWLPVITTCGFTNASVHLLDGGPYIRTIDGIEWVFEVKDGTISLGSGAVDSGPAILDPDTEGAISIPSEIDNMKVTSIGVGAFYDCSHLTSITIPDGVTSIAESAFGGFTTSLVSIVVNEKNSSFISDGNVLFTKSLTELVFCPRNVSCTYAVPGGVKTIRDYAFANCGGLTSVAIPASVTSIGAEAFSGCNGLGDGVVMRDGWVLAVNGICPAEVVLPKGTVGIACGAFHGHEELTSVTIPEGVTEIADNAFEECCNLESATLPKGLMRIGDFAFAFCWKLESLAVPSTVEDVGANAFSGCSSITDFVLPSNLKNISEWAFDSCTGMSAITIPAGVTNIGQYAFSGCGLTDVTILATSVHMDSAAFYSCGPANVVLPEGLMQIDSRSFYCSNLKSITIPSTVTNIGGSAFCNSGLKSVTIPNSVISIGEAAFWWSEVNEADFEGAPPAGLIDAGLNQDAAIRYNVAYVDEWLPVIAECGFTNATAYDPYPEEGAVKIAFVVPNGESSQKLGEYPTNSIYGALPEARREGCTFAGWYTSLDGTNRVSAFSLVDPNVKTLYARWVEDNALLYAQWEANRYSITFNSNGGTGEMGAQPFLYDQSQALSNNAFTKAGYTFKGWATVADGEVVYKDGASVSNLTTEAEFAVALFAKWEKVIDVAAEEVEEWVGYDLAPKFKKTGETNSQYRKRFEAKYGDDYGAAFFMETGKIGMDGARLCVWHDYVSGTDPLDETSKFTATVTMEDGLPVVRWTPALNGEGVKDGVRQYKVLGAKKLGGSWTEVNGDEADYHFFKVTVEMP